MKSLKIISTITLLASLFGAKLYSSQSPDIFTYSEFEALQELLGEEILWRPSLSELNGTREKTLCRFIETRQLANIKAVGRLQQYGGAGGCTITLIGKSCAITAGHCRPVLNEAHFNVPTTRTFLPGVPSQNYRFAVDPRSIQLVDNGVGADWAVVRLGKNAITNKYPGETFGYYQTSADRVGRGDPLRIVGFGSSNDPILNFTQQLSQGPVLQTRSISWLGILFRNPVLVHQVDTTGGSSGSPIFNKDGQIVAVHTHGGCNAIRGSGNHGTLIRGRSDLQNAIRSCLQWEKSNLR